MSRTDAGPYSVPERAVDPPVVDGIRVQMCAAIPKAAMHGWRTDLGCASHASTLVELGDDVFPVCLMHETAWYRASVERQCELARQWRWAS